MKRYVAYYRVSTGIQAKSGLGLEGQSASVVEFVKERGEIIADFTEVESGRCKNRPRLMEALVICRSKKATLVVAQLDRLARSVAFVSNLMEAKVEFVAVDMPEANRFMIHILAAVAEYESELISKRIRAAMKAAKARGVKLGSPNPEKGSKLGGKVVKKNADRFAGNVLPIIREIQRAGVSSLEGIAEALTARGVPTSRGGQWWPWTVRLVLDRSC